MLKLAQFGILLHHDDAEREYAYDAGAEKALEAAADAGWVVVSMERDFASVFDLADSVPGHEGPGYEGGSRVPAIAWWPGTIEGGRRNSDIVGSLDFMATFASLAGVELPTEDREGEPTVFDSCDQIALLRGEGPSTRDHWFYMTETRDDPRRCAGREVEGDLEHPRPVAGQREPHRDRPRAVRSVAGPQERYDIFMTSWAEKTWQARQMAARLMNLLPSYQKYPNRPLQTAGISYAMFDILDAQLQKRVQQMLHGMTSG